MYTTKGEWPLWQLGHNGDKKEMFTFGTHELPYVQVIREGKPFDYSLLVVEIIEDPSSLVTSQN